MQTAFTQVLSFEEQSPKDSLGWAEFLFLLGSKFALFEKKQAIGLLVLPTVELAAPILIFGYLYAKFKFLEAHKNSLENFRNLPGGTNLILQTSKGHVQASFVEIQNVDGIEYISVRTQSHSKGGLRTLLPACQANKIILASNQDPNSEKRLGRKVGIDSKFLEAVYQVQGLNNASSLLNSIRLIGKYTDISHEFTHVTIRDITGTCSGNFGDLLRVDEFLNVGEPAFCNFISSFKRNTEEITKGDTSGLAIFRESGAYLRHAHNFKTTSQLIVMDFADNHLEQIVSEFNQSYYNRHDKINFDFEKVPKNIILSAYMGAKR